MKLMFSMLRLVMITLSFCGVVAGTIVGSFIVIMISSVVFLTTLSFILLALDKTMNAKTHCDI